MNWSKYPNFQASEFRCRVTGKHDMRPEFLDVLQAIRNEFKKPMIISSGYRDLSHPVETIKLKGGAHTLGLACDVRIHGADALELIRIAINHGVKRIGVNQKGSFAFRFIHLDIADRFYDDFPQGIWSYS